MYVEPRSEIESYLLSSADAILDIVREGSVATAAMAAFLGSGVDALKAMEFLIKWPNPTSNQSTYRKQLHFRLGRLDDDAEEADHLLQIKSKGETYPRTEHWVAIVLPKKKDLIRMWVYHTFQRPHFNAEQLDWVVKMDGMESIMEFVVPVAAKNRLKPTNWQWGSANDYSSDPFVGAGEIEMTYDGLLTSMIGEIERMEDTMEVSRLPVIIDCDELRYYKKITGQSSDNAPQMGAKLTNFIFTEVHNIFKWRNLDGTTESAMEVGLRTRCSQVPSHNLLRPLIWLCIKGSGG
jgi:hypothetical protein